MTREGALDSISPPLTPLQAVDFDEAAAILSDVSGRDITRTVVDDEEWKATAVERGMPALAADFTLGIFRAARRGEFSATDPALEELLGRPATPVRAVIESIVEAHG